MRLKENNMSLRTTVMVSSFIDNIFQILFVLSQQFCIGNVKQGCMIVALYKKSTNTGLLFYSSIQMYGSCVAQRFWTPGGGPMNACLSVSPFVCNQFFLELANYFFLKCCTTIKIEKQKKLADAAFSNNFLFVLK